MNSEDLRIGEIVYQQDGHFEFYKVFGIREGIVSLRPVFDRTTLLFIPKISASELLTSLALTSSEVQLKYVVKRLKHESTI